MARITGDNLIPESTAKSMLRRALRGTGLTCRGNVLSLPGRPDIVVGGVAVFVDGCFWHGCPRHFRLPKTDRAWWRTKIAANVRRDRRNRRCLRSMGWRTVTVRECRIGEGVRRALRIIKEART